MTLETVLLATHSPMVNLNRTIRRLLALLVLLGLLAACVQTQGPDLKGPRFSFGLVADCQYCQAPKQGLRNYTQSPAKLEACVQHFNEMDLAYVMHLGDFIDRDYASFDVVAPIYDRLRCPHHHVLGNHDFFVADAHKASVPRRLGMPARYYDFEVNGWRFVALDGNDLSLHAYPEGSEEYKASLDYYQTHAKDSSNGNGA